VDFYGYNYYGLLSYIFSDTVMCVYLGRDSESFETMLTIYQ